MFSPGDYTGQTPTDHLLSLPKSLNPSPTVCHWNLSLSQNQSWLPTLLQSNFNQKISVNLLHPLLRTLSCSSQTILMTDKTHPCFSGIGWGEWGNTCVEWVVDVGSHKCDRRCHTLCTQHCHLYPCHTGQLKHDDTSQLFSEMISSELYWGLPLYRP